MSSLDVPGTKRTNPVSLLSCSYTKPPDSLSEPGGLSLLIAVKFLIVFRFLKHCQIHIQPFIDVSSKQLFHCRQFSLIVSNLNSTYTTLQNHFPAVSQFATENPELIQITKDISERIASKKPTTI